MKANLELAAVAKRKRVALGKEHSDSVLGLESQDTSSPEGAKEGGELPEGWRWVTLRGIADIAGGVTKGQKRRSNETIRRVPYLRVANVQRGYLDLSEVKEIEASEVEIESLRLEPGDILFNEGGDRDKLGRGWVWNGELPECVHQNHVFRARLRDSSASAKFISYYGNSAGQRYFYDQGKHTTNLASINLTKLGALPIPLPPPDEQQRIVAEIEKQFTRLEAGVAALRRVQANLKRYRAAVLKAACEGRLVPTEAELAKTGKRKAKFETGEELLARIFNERRQNWQGRGKYKEPATLDSASLPLLPEGWMWATFDQISTLITKGSSPNWQGFNYCEDGIIFVRSENVRWGTLDLDGVAHLPSAFNEKERKSILHEGDVLLNLVGASIGRAAVATVEVGGGNVNQAVAVIRLVAKKTMNQFAMLWLNSTEAQKRIHAEKVDVARANFSLEDTRVLPFPLPPLPEQTRIVAEVERRLSVVEELEAVVAANLQRASRLRQSILQKAFTGQLV